MLTGEEERVSASRLNVASRLWEQARISRAAEDWDVAADAWEEYHPGCGEAEIARSMASLVREGKDPRLVRNGDQIGIVHDMPGVRLIDRVRTAVLPTDRREP